MHCTSKGSVFYNISYMGGLVNRATMPKYQKEYGAGYGIWDGTPPPAGYNLPGSVNGRDMNAGEAIDNEAGFLIMETALWQTELSDRMFHTKTMLPWVHLSVKI